VRRFYLFGFVRETKKTANYSFSVAVRRQYARGLRESSTRFSLQNDREFYVRRYYCNYYRLYGARTRALFGRVRETRRSSSYFTSGRNFLRTRTKRIRCKLNTRRGYEPGGGTSRKGFRVIAVRFVSFQ